MNEKQLQTIFGNYLKENPPCKNAVYELKICKSNAMPFNQVKEHQIVALQQAKNGNLYHKIADSPWGTTSKHRFTAKKPFDCMNIYKAEAYVVICYYKLRQKKEFIFIDVDDFVNEANNSDRKSLTEERTNLLKERNNYENKRIIKM